MDKFIIFDNTYMWGLVKVSIRKVRVTVREVKTSTTVADVVPWQVATWAKSTNNAKSMSLL